MDCDIGYTRSMKYLWKQMFSGRVKLVLLCAGVLGFAFIGFNSHIASKNAAPKIAIPMATAAAPSLPVIDQATVKKTESALFALG